MMSFTLEGHGHQEPQKQHRVVNSSYIFYSIDYVGPINVTLTTKYNGYEKMEVRCSVCSIEDKIIGEIYNGPYDRAWTAYLPVKVGSIYRIHGFKTRLLAVKFLLSNAGIRL